LWRGSRDGFTALQFHHLCDGHANTLTVILDALPVKWESNSPGSAYGHAKGDNRLRSFLFTLRNPHGVPPWKSAGGRTRRGTQSVAIPHVVWHLATALTFLFPMPATQTETVSLELAVTGVARRTRMTRALSISLRARTISQ
jgi:hypothetical protein